MEDPEEKTSFVHANENKTLPLNICYTPCRISSSTLTLQELIKSILCLSIIEAIFGFAFAFAQKNSRGPPWIAAFMLVPQVFLYLFMHTNLVSGGWGAPDSRFWCDVKIMYARGFNTIRTITRMISLTLGFWLIASILKIDSGTIICLLPLLAIITEWQSEISENQSQYDIKAFDKFIKDDDSTMCLESLHYYQAQQTEHKPLTSSFFINIFIKIYVISCLLGTKVELNATFAIPTIVVTVLYICVVPIILDLLYMKSFITFCQLELNRIITDVTLPVMIVAFSLV